MKKIGILTFHFADNYGAVLQSYALRRVVNSLPECCADIINYIPPAFRYARTYQNDYEEKLFENKRRAFKDFLKNKCGIGSVIIYNLKDAELYDYYIAGSDQIWSTTKNFDEYFLPWVPDGAKRISYAASVGLKVTDHKLRVSIMKKYIPQFDSISVREYEHVALINSFSEKKCECVLDPTLLLRAEDYTTLVTEEILRSEKFIFFFWLIHDKSYMRGVEFVNNLSRYTGFQIVHYFNFAPDYMFANDGGSMQFEGVENFLWYIKNAEYVVTNSYHATIFSIQFKTPFYIFVAQNMRTRIDTLCRRLSIADRVVEGYLPMKDVSLNIDFDAISEKISEQRKISMSFLVRALEVFHEEA